MNLMSNARLYQDDGKIKNDLMFDMLPQVKFSMLGQIQPLNKPPSPRTSSSSQTSSANDAGNFDSTTLSTIPVMARVDKNITVQENPSLIESSSNSHRQRQARTLVLLPKDESYNSNQHYSPKDNIGDSPLDFSTKKQKLEKSQVDKNKQNLSKKEEKSCQQNFSEEPDSPCSRLRKILNMKSPVSPSSVVVVDDFDPGTVLNLSKESHDTTSLALSWSSVRSTFTTSSSSTSSSPTAMDMQSFISSPRPATIPSTASSIHHGVFTFPNSTTMGLPPYAMFSPNLSPIMAHTTSTISIPLESPNIPAFSTVGVIASTGSPTLPFGSLSVPPTSSPSGPTMSIGSGKSRVTRPFKAYPKDPLTFPTVGLYGLPVVGQSTGSTESFIHQQSNMAYAEFRKQMLNQSLNGKNRRMGQQKSVTSVVGPLSDSTTSSTNPLNYGLGVGIIEPGAMSNGSGEDCLSASDDGYCGGGALMKNRLNKSDDQMKDEAYWERRRKNNEAAKRSRDARRAKEDEIAIRAAFLEQENLKLRFEVCALKNETAKLRCMLYKSQ